MIINLGNFFFHYLRDICIHITIHVYSHHIYHKVDLQKFDTNHDTYFDHVRQENHILVQIVSCQIIYR